MRSHNPPSTDPRAQQTASTSLATKKEPTLLPDHLIQLLASWQCLAPTNVLIKILQLRGAT